MLGEKPFAIKGKYSIFRAANGRWVVLAPYIRNIYFEDSFKDAVFRMDMHAFDMEDVA